MNPQWFNLLQTRPLNFDPGLPDGSDPWGLYGGGSRVSLPQATTASASQTPPTLCPWLSHPSPGPTSTLVALQSPGHRPRCSWLSLDLCRHLRTSVPRVLGVLFSNYRLWERQSTVWGSHLQFTLNTFSLFSFIHWSSLRCLFKTSTVAFKRLKNHCAQL